MPVKPYDVFSVQVTENSPLTPLDAVASCPPSDAPGAIGTSKPAPPCTMSGPQVNAWRAALNRFPILDRMESAPLRLMWCGSQRELAVNAQPMPNLLPPSAP